MPHTEQSAAAPPPRPGILKQESQQSQQETASPSSFLGLSYSGSPRSTPKTVSIAPGAESVSPLILGKEKSVEDLNLESSKHARRPIFKQRSSRRLAGRPNVSSPELKPLTAIRDSPLASSENVAEDAEQSQPSWSSSYLQSRHVDHVVDQVSTWLKAERSKRAKRRAKRSGANDAKPEPAGNVEGDTAPKDELPSPDSDTESSLNQLEEILKHATSLDQSRSHRKLSSLRHRPSLKKLHSRKLSTASMDTEYTDYFGDEALVPSCDVVLDNSNTLNYPTMVTDISDDSSDEELQRSASFRDQDAWASFKFEIVRIIHTLGLKGWRKVPLDASGRITVDRISGALTNAVYVVTPPSELPRKSSNRGEADETAPKPRKPPPKLLLRIYGPQADHLVDREAELAILGRLALKNIGPRLLGTFANGRFEEYLHAKALTIEEFRSPDTSVQMAKRLRELHDGIDLLDEERDGGPYVWRKWDKWVLRLEQVMSWMDAQIKAQEPGVKPTGPDAWKRRGFICGTEWKVFRKAVEDYRKWLTDQYGGSSKIREELVFAHNDTQCGNILRLVPAGESPLMLPQNSHKQLVVIDFEFACSNLRGLEFANHFTEWCYDYHDPVKPHACKTEYYPKPDAQERFVRAYVQHRTPWSTTSPGIRPSTSSSSVNSVGKGRRRPISMISDFILDARNPYNPSSNDATTSPAADEATAKQAEDDEVQRLLIETKIWRMAASIHWVAWGIVQAKVPGMPNFSPAADRENAADPMEDAVEEDLGADAKGYKEAMAKQQDGGDGESGVAGSINGTMAASDGEAEEQGEEFDNLGYTQHRAMFFWGDAIQLGIVKAEDLPEDVRAKVKTVPY